MSSYMSESKAELVGKVALVTGSGRGMGLAIARGLAGLGAAVAVQDVELGVAEAAAEGIRAGGGKAIALPGDITDPGTPEMLVREAREKLGPVLILVNNAAVQEHVPWTTANVDRLAWQWRGNFLAPLLLTRLAYPDMKAAKWGRVLNVSSVQARRGFAGMVGYSSTKAALENQTTALARELGPEGITVNAIAPGYFDTHRNQHDFPDDKTKIERGKWVPLGRVGEADDVVSSALLLCSDAGAYITGVVLAVDGGISLR
jgi:NAD(P)-dependent dehydrogenase (short-subunit alcohol dehydrogenase family)